MGMVHVLSVLYGDGEGTNLAALHSPVPGPASGQEGVHGGNPFGKAK